LESEKYVVKLPDVCFAVLMLKSLSGRSLINHILIFTDLLAARVSQYKLVQVFFFYKDKANGKDRKVPIMRKYFQKFQSDFSLIGFITGTLIDVQVNFS